MALSCFRYQRPVEITDHDRVTVDIFKSDVADARVLVMDHTGETTLHSHFADEAVWFVLAGRAMFYDENNVAHEVGPHEGVVVPRRTKYWFEAVGDEPLEIFRVAAKDPNATQSAAEIEELRANQAAGYGARHPHVEIERFAPEGAV